jgi:nucleoside-diphosphate-sugar epimerase
MKGARGGAITGSLFTFVHVDDAVRAVRLCCEKVRPGHIALNITSPRSMESWTKQMLEEAYGAVPEFRRELGPMDALVSGEKAMQVLGFVAELPDPLAGL